ncbi:hypothetical protein, partial [Campylobacter coli]|uniref:hypothetical protein n=1 Tax=Campylobacter coli TaxID=195 RepID=UPI001372D3AE
RFRISLLLAVAALFLFSSCNKSNKQGRYIPATASFALVMNGESLNAKLPWEEVKQNELFQQMYADTAMNEMIKAALDNPENTGIDIKKDVILFV